MKITEDELREELKNNSLGAYFGGGFGGALAEAWEIDHASPEELVTIARRNGYSIDIEYEE